MFKIINKEFHVSRGDSGTINFKLALSDSQGYIKYLDDQENIYWYDSVNNILYDNDYNKSNVDVKTLTMQFVNFNANDKIRFNIYEKKGYDKTPILSKLVQVSSTTDNVNISFTEEDTTFGEITNKRIDYWYDITLNDDKTAVCYDEEGAKIFAIYPAKGSEE